MFLCLSPVPSGQEDSQDVPCMTEGRDACMMLQEGSRKGQTVDCGWTWDINNILVSRAEDERTDKQKDGGGEEQGMCILG